jgi:hypothetical protein
MDTSQVTESQALRMVNLPSTPSWRQWLRNHAASQEISTGRIYSRAAIEALAAKIKPLTADIVLPPEQPEQPAPTPRQAPTALQHSKPSPIRSGPALTNRLVADLTTR